MSRLVAFRPMRGMTIIRSDTNAFRRGRLRHLMAACAMTAAVAGCATVEDSREGGRATSGASDGGKLFGLRVSAHPTAAYPGHLLIAASHRSRDHRIEAISLIGPRGQRIRAASLRKVSYVPGSARVLGRPGVGVGVGTGGIGIGFGAPVNFDAFLDSIFLSERSSYRHRTVGVVRRPRSAATPAGSQAWRVRVTLTNGKGLPVHIERPLAAITRPAPVAGSVGD